MSNNPTTDQMNEAIAIFDGWEKKNPREFVKEGQMMYVWEFKYHKSWDWLMPICHKIRDIAFEMRASVTATVQFSKLGEQLMFGTLADVHLKAYQFITWLNQQTTTNEHSS